MRIEASVRACARAASTGGEQLAAAAARAGPTPRRGSPVTVGPSAAASQPRRASAASCFISKPGCQRRDLFQFVARKPPRKTRDYTRRRQAGIYICCRFAINFGESCRKWDGGGRRRLYMTRFVHACLVLAALLVATSARDPVRVGAQLPEAAARPLSGRGHRRRHQFEGARLRLHAQRRHAPLRVRSDTARSSARSARALRLRVRARGARRLARTTSGRWTKARTWSSSSTPRARC